MPAGKTAIFTGSTSGRRPPNAAQGETSKSCRTCSFQSMRAAMMRSIRQPRLKLSSSCASRANPPMPVASVLASLSSFIITPVEASEPREKRSEAGGNFVHSPLVSFVLRLSAQAPAFQFPNVILESLFGLAWEF